MADADLRERRRTATAATTARAIHATPPATPPPMAPALLGAWGGAGVAVGAEITSPSALTCSTCAPTSCDVTVGGSIANVVPSGSEGWPAATSDADKKVAKPTSTSWLLIAPVTCMRRLAFPPPVEHMISRNTESMSLQFTSGVTPVLLAESRVSWIASTSMAPARSAAVWAKYRASLRSCASALDTSLALPLPRAALRGTAMVYSTVNSSTPLSTSPRPGKRWRKIERPEAAKPAVAAAARCRNGENVAAPALPPVPITRILVCIVAVTVVNSRKNVGVPSGARGDWPTGGTTSDLIAASHAGRTNGGFVVDAVTLGLWVDAAVLEPVPECEADCEAVVDADAVFEEDDELVCEAVADVVLLALGVCDGEAPALRLPEAVDENVGVLVVEPLELPVRVGVPVPLLDPLLVLDPVDELEGVSDGVAEGWYW